MTTPFPFVSGAVLTAAQMNAITNLPINNQTASYTLLASDAGKRVIMNVGSANTVTVDDDIFSAGDTIFIANIGTATATITEGSGVNIESSGSLALVQYGGGTLVATSASVFTFFPFAAGAGAVVQVKSVTKTDTFSVAGTTYTDVTGLAVTITPTSATNKILVVASVAASQTVGSNTSYLQLVRGATAIGIGDAAGSRIRATASVDTPANNTLTSSSLSVLDDPNTTSATTYTVQIRANTGASNSFVNRSSADTDATTTPRCVSTITVYEVTP